jgi:hypothetical protein
MAVVFRFQRSSASANKFVDSKQWASAERIQTSAGDARIVGTGLEIDDKYLRNDEWGMRAPGLDPHRPA